MVANFCPGGSGPFFHIRQGEGDLSVVVIIEGVVDQKIELDGVHPGLSSFSLSVIFIGTSDADFSDPHTGGGSSGWDSRLVRHGSCNWQQRVLS